MTTEKIAWVPVYLTEGREWIDTGSICPTPGMAKAKAAKDAHDCGPGWSNVNRLQRIARVTITECPA